MLTKNDPEIPLDDPTPSVIEQAKANGWNAGYYNFGDSVLDNTSYFNPGLIRRPDGLWLLVRRSENEAGNPIGINSVWAVKLDETGTKPQHGVKLNWHSSVPGQQFEDARAFCVPALDQVGVSACTFKWEKNRWTGAVQVLGFFDAEWNCKVTHFVPFDTNGQNLNGVPREHYQKNWLFWLNGKKLCLLYKSSPWIVAEFNNNGWRDRQIHKSEGAQWARGEIRGGTPPILLGDYYITFFHSSMPWTGNYRRYYMGAIAFDTKPPFAPRMITPEPMLVGSQRGFWTQRKPACIFPCGAVCENDRFLISAGMNDLKAIWLDIPVKDVLARLKPIKAETEQVVEEQSPLVEQPVAVPPNKLPPKKAPPQTSEPEDAKKLAMRERMAKLRARRKKRLAPVGAA